MDTDIRALRTAIEEAARGLAEFEKLHADPEASPSAPADATLAVLRAQLGALRAIHGALAKLAAQLADAAEPSIKA